VLRAAGNGESIMRRLPILAAFSHVWATVFRNVGSAFRLSWPWLLILGLLISIVLASSETLFGTPESPKSGGRIFATAFLLIFVYLLAFASIAVNWHRFVLLDEMPSGLKILRLDGSVWRYLGNLLLILLIAALPFGIAIAIILNAIDTSTVPDSDGESLFAGLSPFAIVLFLAVLMVLNIVIYRLMIKLPAVALGHQDYGLAQAWEDSKGNALPILGFAVLFYLSMTIPQKLLDWAGETLADKLGFFGNLQLIIVSILFQWFTLIVGISALTTLYGFFAEKREF
jgi:hypothetical protein